MTDVSTLIGGAHLSQLIGGYLPPRRKFEIDMIRADDRGAPMTVHAVFAVRALSAAEMEEAHAEAIKWLVSKGGHTREEAPHAALVRERGEPRVPREGRVPPDLPRFGGG